MVMKVKKGTVTGSCNSCGHKAILDNGHKLAAYIVKNPPKNVSEFKDDKGKKGSKDDKKAEKTEKTEKHSKKDKEKEKEKEKKPTDEGSDGEAEKDEEAKEKKEKKEKKEEPATESKVSGVYDFKAHGKLEKMHSLKCIEDALIAKINEVYKKHASVESFEDHEDAVEEIINTCKTLDLPPEHHGKIPYLIFNAIFDVNIAKQVSKNAAILTKAYEVFDVSDSEQDLLLNLELFLLVKNDEKVFEKYIPTLLKLFYDEDLLTEEFLLDWDDGKLVPKFMMDWRYLAVKDEKTKTAAKPFLTWLR